jgi:hypothetical protein
MLGSNNSAISGASAGELQATEEPSDSYGTVVTVERGIHGVAVTNHRDADELIAASRVSSTQRVARLQQPKGYAPFHHRNGDTWLTTMGGLGGRKPHRAGRDDLLRRAGGATDDVHRTTRRGLPARG